MPLTTTRPLYDIQIAQQALNSTLVNTSAIGDGPLAENRVCARCGCAEAAPGPSRPCVRSTPTRIGATASRCRLRSVEST